MSDKITKLVKLPRITELSSEHMTTIYRRVHDRTLTPPIKLGRSSVWPENEIVEIVNARIAGKSDDEIRELVKHLIAQRQQVAPSEFTATTSHTPAPLGAPKGATVTQSAA